MTLVAVLRPVLADADLVAEDVSTTFTVTVALGERSVLPSPPISSTFGWNEFPAPCWSRSTSSVSPSRTRYCLPPTEMIA